MRKYEISPAIVAAMRNRALAAPFAEVGVPLYLELPRYEEYRAPGFTEFDADDGRIEAETYVVGGDEDDDFY